MAPLYEAHGDIASLNCRFSLTYLEDKRLYLYFYLSHGTKVVRAACKELDGAKKFQSIASRVRTWSTADFSRHEIFESQARLDVVFDDAEF